VVELLNKLASENMRYRALKREVDENNEVANEQGKIKTWLARQGPGDK
jgi:hypothetical protein